MSAEVSGRSTPAPPTSDADEAELARFVARLAADGLRVYESLADRLLDPEARRRIAMSSLRGSPIDRPPTTDLTACRRPLPMRQGRQPQGAPPSLRARAAR